MKFKLKDYVRVKAGVLLEETGELVPGWVGEVTELPKTTDDTIYMIELDALSLQQLPDEYNQERIESEETPFFYRFDEKDLEPSIQRDTAEERKAQQMQMEDTYYSSDEEELSETTLLKWCAEFEQSTFFNMLTAQEQNDVYHTLHLFSDYAFNYPGEQPEEWTRHTVNEVCLEIMPRKLTTTIERFGEIGNVLTQFFAFLHEQQLHTNALELHQEIKKIIPNMIRNAKNPSNWGIAKSMMMGALAENIDPSDQNALNNYMYDYQSKMLAQINNKPLMQPARHNPFKNLSRNQVIQVKYTDGRVVEGKFKRLENDLLSGACELIV